MKESRKGHEKRLEVIETKQTIRRKIHHISGRGKILQRQPIQTVIKHVRRARPSILHKKGCGHRSLAKEGFSGYVRRHVVQRVIDAPAHCSGVPRMAPIDRRYDAWGISLLSPTKNKK